VTLLGFYESAKKNPFLETLHLREKSDFGSWWQGRRHYGAGSNVNEPNNTHATGVIRKGQILANAPELFHYAHI
jgi:hypothetical protein